MKDVLGKSIEKLKFPNDQPEGAPSDTRRCTSYGEAASAFPGNKLTPSRVAEHFRCFYNGFTETSTIRYPYYGEDPIFEYPICFDSATNTFDREILEILIKPGILPTNLFAGKTPPTYEFYNPSAAARQLGFGQLLIGVYFADRVWPREKLSNGLEYDRLQLSPRLQHD